jgi:squalene-hopene/tetraprenyl-beta-curcumene cyclase
MNTTDLVHHFSADVPPQQTAPRKALAPSRYELVGPVRNSILRGRSDLISRQRLDGSWAGNSTCDVSSLVHLVLLDAYLARVPSEATAQAVPAILHEQQPAGGWSFAPDGAESLDASVLAYFALKLAGENANRPEMVRARQVIRQRAGADACAAATRLWFAVLGQITYDQCPPIVPEWLLTTCCTGLLSAPDERRLAAYAVVWTTRPRREVEFARGIRELFVEQPQNWPTPQNYLAEQPAAALSGFWLGCERIGLLPLRKRALDRANFLLTEAALEPPRDALHGDELAWGRIALGALGHGQGSRVISAWDRQQEEFVGAEPDDARSQPATSLTADTAMAIEALRASGIAVHETPVAAGIDWLLTHRLQSRNQNRPAIEVTELLQVSGSLLALDTSTDPALPPKIKVAFRRSAATRGRRERRPAIQFEQFVDQLLRDALTLQQGDGGWSFSDRSRWNHRFRGLIRASARCQKGASEAVPTGTMLELLSRHARVANDTPIARGVAFLRSRQRGDGRWESNDGTQPLFATACVVRGLLAVGIEGSDPIVAAGVNWLLVQQQSSGGWREACNTCTGNGQLLTDEPTVIETAATILALVAAGLANHEATRRGVEFLIDCQQDDGSWSESQSTDLGSAARRGSNDLHFSAWSLIALSRWVVAIKSRSDGDEPSHLRLICGDLGS